MESDKESLSFGRYLQAIRLEKKISLEQVSEQTRIGLGNLLLIEQENHEQLPAQVYVKGFLRSYAKAIGADGDEVIRRYDSCLEVVQKISDSESASKGTGRRIWWKLLISLVLLICIIGASLLAVFFLRQAPTADNPSEQKTTAETEQAVDTQAAQKGLDPDPRPVKAVPEKWLLHVAAVEETWLKVIMDEKESNEYHLNTGDELELEAVSGFNLLIGNAGGIKLTLNDKPVPISGKSGDVVTIELP
jgi:cytoskeletal protein RodZ